VNGYDPLLQEDFADTAGGWIYDGYPSRPDLWSEMATADVLRVTTLILAEDITPTGPGWERAREPIPTAGYVRWERDPALPEAYLVGGTETRTLAEMPGVLADTSVDFESVAFVEDDSLAQLSDPGPAGEVLASDLAESGRIEIDADRDALLVLSRAWQDGWSAKVDGDEAKLIRANGLVLGVVVPEGEHVVTISFTPPGVRVGFVIAVIAAFLGFALAPLIAFVQRRRSRSRGASDERVAPSEDG
jgi:Bacterial membrane protein YfhO